jgi:hypothetical protein
MRPLHLTPLPGMGRLGQMRCWGPGEPCWGQGEAVDSRGRGEGWAVGLQQLQLGKPVGWVGRLTSCRHRCGRRRASSVAVCRGLWSGVGLRLWSRFRAHGGLSPGGGPAEAGGVPQGRTRCSSHRRSQRCMRTRVTRVTRVSRRTPCRDASRQR